MKKFLDKVVDRALAAAGVDLDFTLDPLSTRISKITEDLYLGACPQASQLAPMKEVGITHVVSAVAPQETPVVAFLEPHIRTWVIPLRDVVGQHFLNQLPAFYDFVRDARRSGAGGKVLIHCQAGVSRSASLAIALLMQRRQLSFFAAFRTVRDGRPQVLPNLGFATQLQQLEFDAGPRMPTGGGPSSLARYLQEVCQVPDDADVIEDMLRAHGYDAMRALHAMYGADIPRVVHGIRV